MKRKNEIQGIKKKKSSEKSSEKSLIYLDYNATTPIDPEVAQAMLPFLEEHFGNPSCAYSLGVHTRKALEKAREWVAKILNAEADEILFTSGGTESNSHAIWGLIWALEKKGNHIITSQVEHSSILQPCRFLEKKGFSVTYLPVNEYGQVSPEEMEKSITPQTILISIMHANNEVGTLQPVERIGEIARSRGIVFHCDGAQAVGKVESDVKKISADLYTLAGHKLYGPKGVGALYIRRGTPLENLFRGAGQEKGRRAGTENVMSLVGLGKACEKAFKKRSSRAREMKKMRDLLWTKISTMIPQARFNGHPEERLPNTLSVSFPHIQAHELMKRILHRIAASPGAACHSDGKIKTSHVLEAMKVPSHLAQGTLRFSTGKDSTKEEMEEAAQILSKVVESFQEII